MTPPMSLSLLEPEHSSFVKLTDATPLGDLELNAQNAHDC